MRRCFMASDQLRFDDPRFDPEQTALDDHGDADHDQPTEADQSP